MSNRAPRSLRATLLRVVLPPIAGLVAFHVLVADQLALERAHDAYDEALVDAGIALGAHIKVADESYRFEVPQAVDRALRADRHDTIHYRVLDPYGRGIGGDPGLRAPAPDEAASGRVIAYPSQFLGKPVRVVSLPVRCGQLMCSVQVAETTHKRSSLLRNAVLTSLVPELLIALAAVAVVWFGVARGLAPLARLSEEIRARSPSDLKPIDASGTFAEARPLVTALNHFLARADESSRNQQRFLANAAHQLRTPLASLQAYLDLVQEAALPPQARADLERVRETTARTARLAEQLLALARAEPGGVRREAPVALNLKHLVEAAADEWVKRALARRIDLGFDLAEAPVAGDAVLLREALANLIHNALEYTPAGGRVTVRAGVRGEPRRAFLAVEDDGPGIPVEERARVTERFYRIPGTPGTGSGLGLAIVREIAVSHGAEIEIADARPNAAGSRGCRVTLVFPAKSGGAQQA